MTCFMHEFAGVMLTKLQGAVEILANATEVVGDKVINAANKVIETADKILEVIGRVEAITCKIIPLVVFISNCVHWLWNNLVKQ